MHQHSHTVVPLIGALGDAQMESQRVDKRTLIMAVPGMDHHPCRFVQHQHIIVFVHYVQGYILRQYLHSPAAVWHHEANHIAGTHYVIGLDRLVPYLHEALLDGALHPVTRGVLHMGRHIFVDTQGLLPRIDIKAEMFEQLFVLLFFQQFGINLRELFHQATDKW